VSALVSFSIKLEMAFGREDTHKTSTTWKLASTCHC